MGSAFLTHPSWKNAEPCFNTYKQLKEACPLWSWTLGWSVCLCLKLLLKFSQPFLKIVERYDVLCGLFEAQIIYMIEYEDCSSCLARIICLLATCHPSMTSQPAGAIFRLHPICKRSLTEFAMLTTVRSESSDFDLSATEYRLSECSNFKFMLVNNVYIDGTAYITLEVSWKDRRSISVQCSVVISMKFLPSLLYWVDNKMLHKFWSSVLFYHAYTSWFLYLLCFLLVTWHTLNLWRDQHRAEHCLRPPSRSVGLRSTIIIYQPIAKWNYTQFAL